MFILGSECTTVSPGLEALVVTRMSNCDSWFTRRDVAFKETLVWFPVEWLCVRLKRNAIGAVLCIEIEYMKRSTGKHRPVLTFLQVISNDHVRLVIQSFWWDSGTRYDGNYCIIQFRGETPRTPLGLLNKLGGLVTCTTPVTSTKYYPLFLWFGYTIRMNL